MKIFILTSPNKKIQQLQVAEKIEDIEQSYYLNGYTIREADPLEIPLFFRTGEDLK